MEGKLFKSLAEDLGVSPRTLRRYERRKEAPSAKRGGKLSQRKLYRKWRYELVEKPRREAKKRREDRDRGGVIQKPDWQRKLDSGEIPTFRDFTGKAEEFTNLVQDIKESNPMYIGQEFLDYIDSGGPIIFTFVVKPKGKEEYSYEVEFRDYLYHDGGLESLLWVEFRWAYAQAGAGASISVA